jgi:hypothetical protein
MAPAGQPLPFEVPAKGGLLSGEGQQCSAPSAVEILRCLFHEAFQVKSDVKSKLSKGVMQNEACSLWQ